jgi:hypothetical protein
MQRNNSQFASFDATNLLKLRQLPVTICETLALIYYVKA